MFEFDKNDGFLWAIILLGVLTPAIMTLFALMRAGGQKMRVLRLKSEEADLSGELRRMQRIRLIQIAVFSVFVLLVLFVRLGRTVFG